MQPRNSPYLIARGKGRFYSGLFHAAFVILAIIGLPDFMIPEPPVEPIAISVELLPVSEISNVKPRDTKKPENDTKKQEEAPKKKSPPVKTQEAAPKKANPEPVPEAKLETTDLKKAEKKKEAPKPKEKAKKAPPKKEPKKNDLAAILKAVRETAQQARKEDTPEKPKKIEPPSLSESIASSYNDSIPMSLSERDMIMSQIAKCWNVPAGARNAQNLVVIINAEYSIDGQNLRVEVAPENMGKYQSDNFFRAAADAAVRAVQRCSPLKSLPPEKYDTWHYMVLRFDPKYMLN